MWLYGEKLYAWEDPLHLLIVIEINFFHRIVTHADPVGANKHAVVGLACEVTFPFDAKRRDGMSPNRAHIEGITHDPSFLPMGSSYSMPTQMPSPAPNFVVPTNRTVPRLWKPSSMVSTSHLDPTGMLTSGTAFSSGCSLSANLPILCRCLYARTESSDCLVEKPCQQLMKRTLSLSVGFFADLELLHL